MLAGNTAGLMKTDRADLKILEIHPGQRTSHHSHLIAESIYHVTEGNILFLHADGSETQLNHGDTFIIDPGEPHCIQNAGNSIARVVEIESPPHRSSDKLALNQTAPIALRKRPLGQFWSPSLKPRLKVCGVRSADAAWACHEAGADAIGLHLVGTTRSRRIEEYSHWLPAMPNSLSIFLLTEETNPYVLCEMLRASCADTIQLQGTHTLNTIASISLALRPRGWKFVRTLPMDEGIPNTRRDDVEAIAPYVDAILLDSSARGGTGMSHDWDESAALVRFTKTPIILAGGINSTNIAAAVARVAPMGIDVESGSERILPLPEGGRITVKDPVAIRALVDLLR
mgnify:CR=1 FL=1